MVMALHGVLSRAGWFRMPEWFRAFVYTFVVAFGALVAYVDGFLLWGL